MEGWGVEKVKGWGGRIGGSGACVVAEGVCEGVEKVEGVVWAGGRIGRGVEGGGSPGTGGSSGGSGAGSALGLLISLRYFRCRSSSFCFSYSMFLALCTTCACTGV